jgi:hypothetical protein
MNATTATEVIPELAKSLVAERDTLGAVLFDPEKLGQATLAGLAPEHFASLAHRRIFAVMLALKAEGLQVELTAVTDKLATDSEVGAIGGAAYIASLVDGQYRGAGFGLWVSKIRNCWILRRVSAGAESLWKAAERPENLFNPQEAVRDIYSEARTFQAELFSAVMSADYWPEPKPITGAVPSVLPLPLECLPLALRELVGDIADRMQVPIDYPAAASIVALAGCVNRRAVIRRRGRLILAALGCPGARRA